MEHGVAVIEFPLVQQCQVEHLRFIRTFRHLRKKITAVEGNHRHPVILLVAQGMYQACRIGHLLGKDPFTIRFPAFLKQAEIEIPDHRGVRLFFVESGMEFFDGFRCAGFDGEVSHVDFTVAQPVRFRGTQDT